MNVASKEAIRMETSSDNYQIRCLFFRHMFMNKNTVKEAAVRKSKKMGRYLKHFSSHLLKKKLVKSTEN